MNEIVERVGFALFSKMFHKNGRICWDRLEEDERQKWYEDARAAIEAMREPTEKMSVEGQLVRTGYDDMSSAYEIWQTMIDAALA